MNNRINPQGYVEYSNSSMMANAEMYHQVTFNNRNIGDTENQNVKYWIEKANYDRIMYNEQMKYNFFKQKEQWILSNINRPNFPIYLWRYKDKFYYRSSQFSELIIGDEKTIAKEISSRYYNLNIHLVNDINDTLSYKKMSIRIDTTYIAINSIPVVNDEVFDVSQMEEVFVNEQGFYSRNTLSYTSYLHKRFYDYNLQYVTPSKALAFIHSMTIIKDMEW